MQKSKVANQSFLNVNNTYIEEYIARLDESGSKDDYNNSISRIDQQYIDSYADFILIMQPRTIQTILYLNNCIVCLEKVQSNFKFLKIKA